MARYSAFSRHVVFAQYVDDVVVELASGMSRAEASARALEEYQLEECASVHIRDDDHNSWTWDPRSRRWASDR